MAPAASYDFHVDGQAAIAAKRAFALPPFLLLFLYLYLTFATRNHLLSSSSSTPSPLPRGREARL